MRATRLFPFIIAATLSITTQAATVTVVGKDGLQQIEYSSIVIDRHGNVTIVLNSREKLSLPTPSGHTLKETKSSRSTAPYPRPW